jgi:hypothetical protein
MQADTVMAEEELAAFLSAVDRNYGPAKVRRAGEYWVDALEAAALKSDASVRDWRRVTIMAASRLADDLCVKERTGRPFFMRGLRILSLEAHSTSV